MANERQSTSAREVRDIVLITTGGTIEKTYDEFEGSLDNHRSEIKNKIATKLRLPYSRLHLIDLLAKDSLLLTKQDRQLIVDTLKREIVKGWPVVVLHGTDTMDKTLELAFREIADLAVPIVFTGAMRPMGFEDSDSVQNLSEALLAAQLLPKGVYLCFHNRVFAAPKVRKNKEQGIFEQLPD